MMYKNFCLYFGCIICGVKKNKCVGILLNQSSINKNTETQSSLSTDDINFEIFHLDELKLSKQHTDLISSFESHEISIENNIKDFEKFFKCKTIFCVELFSNAEESCGFNSAFRSENRINHRYNTDTNHKSGVQKHGKGIIFHKSHKSPEKECISKILNKDSIKSEFNKTDVAFFTKLHCPTENKYHILTISPSSINEDSMNIFHLPMNIVKSSSTIKSYQNVVSDAQMKFYRLKTDHIVYLIKNIGDFQSRINIELDFANSLLKFIRKYALTDFQNFQGIKCLKYQTKVNPDNRLEASVLACRKNGDFETNKDLKNSKFFRDIHEQLDFSILDLNKSQQITCSERFESNDSEDKSSSWKYSIKTHQLHDDTSPNSLYESDLESDEPPKFFISETELEGI